MLFTYNFLIGLGDRPKIVPRSTRWTCLVYNNDGTNSCIELCRQKSSVLPEYSSIIAEYVLLSWDQQSTGRGRPCFCNSSTGNKRINMLYLHISSFLHPWLLEIDALLCKFLRCKAVYENSTYKYIYIYIYICLFREGSFLFSEPFSPQANYTDLATAACRRS
jgi:hypothetical protein